MEVSHPLSPKGQDLINIYGAQALLVRTLQTYSQALIELQ